ncbi:AAA family ATPase [uncultured Methanobrevibacter sp.]|uniref:AAA family ATPase n=1 Tax=uncultured Methanobrevibacter sp. TaxID=253161 RepID=UPI0025EF6FC8|nr:AAA family ATPase [uncultured Methanobrevibacter sp.]
MSIIKHIKIENLSYKMDNDDFIDRLNDLSRVNIFVGANNTGKSRFMRSLFFNKGIPLRFLPNDKLFQEYVDGSKKFKADENSLIGPYSPEKQRAYDDIKNASKEISFIEESKTPLSELVNVYKRGVVNASSTHKQLLKPYVEYFETFFPNLEFNDQLFNYNFYKIYVPSLRGLIPITFKEDNHHGLKQDFYAERIKKDYFSDDSKIKTDILDYLIRDDSITDSEDTVDLKTLIEKTYFPKNSIMSGQRFYDYVKNYLLGDLEQREMIREYENYLSETFFDKKDVVLIPKVNDDVLTVKIGYEEYKIYDLGEGIQSIILMTLPLFLYLNKSKEKNTNVLVFIEEPEVGLHPRLQRVFIETLLDERFENYQFFFTTHSNHFIDMTLESDDISIYLFDKFLNDDGVSSVEFHIKPLNLAYSPALKKLGALPSSVLIRNCTILVEGTHDIPHYSLYLDLYQKHLKEENPNFRKYKEDVHYSFFRGGGNETLNTIDDFNDYEKERNFFISDFDNENKKNELEGVSDN